MEQSRHLENTNFRIRTVERRAGLHPVELEAGSKITCISLAASSTPALTWATGMQVILALFFIVCEGSLTPEQISTFSLCDYMKA